MANLIMQDTFEPYYAGRERSAGKRARPTAGKKQKKAAATKQADHAGKAELADRERTAPRATEH
jgi:hypothetical protein